MSDGLNSLIHKSAADYANLQVLQPNHELLRYFVLNERGFIFTNDFNLRTEFFNRFGYVNRASFKNQSDFEEAIKKEGLENYINTLEEAVRSFIED